MEVRKARHVESDEPDASGCASYSYEYDIYEFFQDGLCLVARSYTDCESEAHFLRKVVQSQNLMLTAEDFNQPVMLLALAALKADGKIDIRFLSQATGEYAQIPVGT